MKPNYKNWVPKNLIAGMAAATVISIAALTVFGIYGLWVTKTWRIILAIVFAVASNYVYHNISGADKQQLLLETLRTLKKGGTFAIHDLMGKNRYGDMEAFCRKLKEMGYAEVRMIATTDGMFMTKKEASCLMLQGSTLLVGRK